MKGRDDSCAALRSFQQGIAPTSLVRHIRADGQERRFCHWRFISLRADGHLYWRTGTPLEGRGLVRGAAGAARAARQRTFL